MDGFVLGGWNEEWAGVIRRIGNLEDEGKSCVMEVEKVEIGKVSSLRKNFQAICDFLAVYSYWPDLIGTHWPGFQGSGIGTMFEKM
jgi:hypothetical protein